MICHLSAYNNKTWSSSVIKTFARPAIGISGAVEGAAKREIVIPNRHLAAIGLLDLYLARNPPPAMLGKIIDPVVIEVHRARNATYHAALLRSEAGECFAIGAAYWRAVRTCVRARYAVYEWVERKIAGRFCCAVDQHLIRLVCDAEIDSRGQKHRNDCRDERKLDQCLPWS